MRPPFRVTILKRQALRNLRHPHIIRVLDVAWSRNRGSICLLSQWFPVVVEKCWQLNLHQLLFVSEFWRLAWLGQSLFGWCVSWWARHRSRRLYKVGALFFGLQQSAISNSDRVTPASQVADHPDSICFIMEFAAGGELSGAQATRAKQGEATRLQRQVSSFWRALPW